MKDNSAANLHFDAGYREAVASIETRADLNSRLCELDFAIEKHRGIKDDRSVRLLKAKRRGVLVGAQDAGVE